MEERFQADVWEREEKVLQEAWREVVGNK